MRIVILSKYPGYLISDTERIQGPGGVHTKNKPRWLKPSLTPDGYETVSLVVNKKKVIKRVHSLVCEAFNGDRPKDLLACHID